MAEHAGVVQAVVAIGIAAVDEATVPILLEPLAELRALASLSHDADLSGLSALPRRMMVLALAPRCPRWSCLCSQGSSSSTAGESRRPAPGCASTEASTGSGRPRRPRRVLGEPGFCEAARRVAEEIAGLPDVSPAVPLLEELALR